MSAINRVSAAAFDFGIILLEPLYTITVCCDFGDLPQKLDYGALWNLTSSAQLYSTTRTPLPVKLFKYVWFDDKYYYEFFRYSLYTQVNEGLPLRLHSCHLSDPVKMLIVTVNFLQPLPFHMGNTKAVFKINLQLGKQIQGPL